MNNMKKTSKKKSIGKWVVLAMTMTAAGLIVGYGLFLATSNNRQQSKDAMSEIGDVSNETFATENPPEISSYEGSEAEQKTKKEIPITEQESLKENIGENGYVNKAYGYAFVPPEGWFADPINSEISPSVYFSTYDPQTTSAISGIPGVKFEALVQDNYKNQSLDEWIADGHNIAGEIYQTEKISIGEYEAYREEYDFDGDTYTVTFIKGSDVYIFSMYGDNKEVGEKKSVFNAIIDSLIVI